MDPLLLGGAALAGTAAVAVVFGMRALATAPESEVLDRAARVTRTTRIALSVPTLSADKRSLWAAMLVPLGSLARPRDRDKMSIARRYMVYAGFRADHAVEVYYGVKLALSLLLGGGLLAVSASLPAPIPNIELWTVAAVGFGMFAPSIWLDRRITARQTALARSLADTLDLLVTCVEAGLPLDAALARIGQEIGSSAPELSSELRQTTMEIQAGVPRADAFRRMAVRTGVEDLRSLSAVIIQTEMFGTPVARALRVHSATMRTRRTHQAEERAATASVKMLVPLILFILPSLFSVILGPAVVRIVTTLMPTLKGAQ
jgi:tight adherence protein C